MVSRKRGRETMENVEPPLEKSLLERLRNSWEFASLAQWIFIFGRAVKIDDNLDIEDLEMEFLKSHSTVLPEIGLALLKFVSSHRGLTPEIFDEYTRRQYVAKASHRNPYGVEEEPAKFADFDTFTKLRVLQQLTQWTFGNPDRIRERMEEQKDLEQTIWRIEPLGWDADDRTYFVLDDNRLYRRTDAPLPQIPAAKPKKNSKKAKAALRASKRRKLSEPTESEKESSLAPEGLDTTEREQADDGFGGMTWECIAITLDEYNAFTDSIQKSRDPNEKILRKRVIDDVLPLLEKQEEARRRKAAQKERELLNLEKMATAKRSSRIRDKAENHRQEEEAREAERKRQADIDMARKEQEKWQKLEKERESRMITREQRLKEREARRILHEEELASLSEDSKKVESGTGRLSERHLKAEIEKKKQALEELAEEEDWIFDCICGAYGQIDDGTHSIACDKCNIWLHSKCAGVKEADADSPDFNFVCTTCLRRAKDAERAKTQPPIKIKINRPGSSSSAAQGKDNQQTAVPASTANVASNGSPTPQLQASPAKKSMPQLASWQTGSLPSPKFIVQARSNNQAAPQTSPTNGHVQQVSLSQSFSPHKTANPFIDSGNVNTPQQSFARPSSSHAFSSPHPRSPTNLPPPDQGKTYAFVNGNNRLNQYSMQTDKSYPANTSASFHGTPYNISSTPGTSAIEHRRSSMVMPSPLSSAPNLPPANVQQTPIPAPRKSHSPSVSFSAAVQPIASSPVPVLSPKFQATPHSSDPSQNSALPPSSTGLSPTKQSPPRPTAATPSFTSATPSALPHSSMGISPVKQSPPRPTTANSSFGSATPSAFQPMTSLSPNAQVQNLTPPVKLFGNGLDEHASS